MFLIEIWLILIVIDFEIGIRLDVILCDFVYIK